MTTDTFDSFWHAIQILCRRHGLSDCCTGKDRWYDYYDAGLLPYQAFYVVYPQFECDSVQAELERLKESKVETKPTSEK